MGPLIEQGGGTIEYRFRHRDGHYIWIQDTFRVMRDEQGNPLEIVGSWADISGRKQAEEALGERMAVMNDLETLVGASPAIIYTTQVTGDYACTFVERINPDRSWAMRRGRCATTRVSGAQAASRRCWPACSPSISTG